MAEQAAAQGLAREPSFRRFLATSTALHLGMVGFVLYMPHFPTPLRPPAIVMVDVNLTAPAPPAPPKPAPPAPPEPPAPTPPAAEPEPKRTVDEAVVIPPVPRAKPLDKERPEPEPEPKPPEKKPEPPKPPQKPPEKKPEPPKPPPPSAAELIQRMRDKVGPVAPPSDAPPNGAPGELDPELASYQQRLQACFYSNWVGIQRYRRRQDLQVEFQVRVNPTGGIVSVDKVRASGESVLDESAERAIFRCAPQFPPPPEGRTLLRFIFIPGDAI